MSVEPVFAPRYGFFLLPKHGQKLALSTEQHRKFNSLRSSITGLLGRYITYTPEATSGYQWASSLTPARYETLLGSIRHAISGFLAQREFRIISAPDNPTKVKQRTLAERLARCTAFRSS